MFGDHLQNVHLRALGWHNLCGARCLTFCDFRKVAAKTVGALGFWQVAHSARFRREWETVEFIQRRIGWRSASGAANNGVIKDR